MGRAAGPPGTGQGTSSSSSKITSWLAGWRPGGGEGRRESARERETVRRKLGSLGAPSSESRLQITDYRFQVPGAGSELGAESSDARMPI